MEWFISEAMYSVQATSLLSFCARKNSFIFLSSCPQSVQRRHSTAATGNLISTTRRSFGSWRVIFTVNARFHLQRGGNRPPEKESDSVAFSIIAALTTRQSSATCLRQSCQVGTDTVHKRFRTVASTYPLYIASFPNSACADVFTVMIGRLNFLPGCIRRICLTTSTSKRLFPKLRFTCSPFTSFPARSVTDSSPSR